jgi:hypothetical protein
MLYKPYPIFFCSKDYLFLPGHFVEATLYLMYISRCKLVMVGETNAFAIFYLLGYIIDQSGWIGDASNQ